MTAVAASKLTLPNWAQREFGVWNIPSWRLTKKSKAWDTWTLTSPVLTFLILLLVPKCKPFCILLCFCFCVQRLIRFAAGDLYSSSDLKTNLPVTLCWACSVPFFSFKEHRASAVILLLCVSQAILLNAEQLLVKRAAKTQSTSFCTYKYTLFLHTESLKLHRGACTSLQHCPSKVPITGTALCSLATAYKTNSKSL